MNAKAEKYSKFLKEKNIRVFRQEELGDRLGAVVYRSFLNVEGQNLPLLIGIDKSVFVMMRVRLGTKLVNEKNETALLRHFNSMNAKYKVFKYSANAAGDVVLESCLTTGEENFRPELVHVVLDLMLKHLREEYTAFMRLVWESKE